MQTFFGTDGIRAQVGTGLLTAQHLPAIGSALAQWALEKYKKSPEILIIHDTRASCSFVKAALKSGLLMHSLTLHDAGVMPTPAAVHLMKLKRLDCALVISASHNPWHDNGIKVLDASGKLMSTDEGRISELININLKTPNSGSYSSFGLDIPCVKAQDLYVNQVLSYFPTNFLAGKKIVLDVANGATHEVAPALFKACGAEVITLHNIPNGFNINDSCGALYAHNIGKAVIQHGAYAGFAFDGDGDRVIAVNKFGEIKDGDDLLAILTGHPVYVGEKTVVGTVMSNQGFVHFLNTANRILVRTPVGDKHIVERLTQDNLLLGGEPAGHIIMRDIISTGDGIVAALRVLQAMLLTDNHDMQTYAKFPQVLINMPVLVKKDLTTGVLSDIIAQAQSHLQAGRLLVRYSGTEPLLRVMVEAASHEHAFEVAHNLSQKLNQEINC